MLLFAHVRCSAKIAWQFVPIIPNAFKPAILGVDFHSIVLFGTYKDELTISGLGDLKLAVGGIFSKVNDASILNNPSRPTLESKEPKVVFADPIGILDPSKIDFRADNSILSPKIVPIPQS